MAIPPISDLVEVAFQCIKLFGGETTSRFINESIAEVLNLTEEERKAKQNKSTTILRDRISKALKNLTSFGLIWKTRSGVWALTEKGHSTETTISIDFKPPKRKKSETQRQSPHMNETTASIPRPTSHGHGTISDTIEMNVLSPLKRRNPIINEEDLDLIETARLQERARSIVLPNKPYYFRDKR